MCDSIEQVERSGLFVAFPLVTTLTDYLILTLALMLMLELTPVAEAAYHTLKAL